MNRKKLMHVVTVILVLALALSACGGEKAPEETTAAATAAPTVPAETTVPQPLSLTDWNMSASTWSSPNGATIHITATPNYYLEGQTADFVVRLEGDDVTSVACQWDGTSYTASADLNAANGYCYYMVLTTADGTASEVAVNTPAAPTNEAFVNMEASLESYCSIILEESDVADNKLTLSAGKVQVQAPVITNNGESISCQQVELVLTFAGEEIGIQTVALTGTNTIGLFEAALENLVFDIPELEVDQKIELTAHAELTNGQLLSAFGGSWLCDADGVLPAVG